MSIDSVQVDNAAFTAVFPERTEEIFPRMVSTSIHTFSKAEQIERQFASNSPFAVVLQKYLTATGQDRATLIKSWFPPGGKSIVKILYVLRDEEMQHLEVKHTYVPQPEAMS